MQAFTAGERHHCSHPFLFPSIECNACCLGGSASSHTLWPWGHINKKIMLRQIPKQTGEPSFLSPFYIHLFEDRASLSTAVCMHHIPHICSCVKTTTNSTNTDRTGEFKPCLQFWAIQLIYFSRILQVLKVGFRSGLCLHLAPPVFKHAFQSHEPGSPEVGNGFKTGFSMQAKCPIINNLL